MRVKVEGRILVGSHHLDVAADYHDGPVPCIAARERYLRDVLLPLTVRLLDEAHRSILAEQET